VCETLGCAAVRTEQTVKTMWVVDVDGRNWLERGVTQAGSGEVTESGGDVVGSWYGLDATSVTERHAETTRHRVLRASTDEMERRTTAAQVYTLSTGIFPPGTWDVY